MLCFIPQSTAIIFFCPLLYRIGFLSETSATRFDLFGSSKGVLSFLASAVGCWTIFPSIVPWVRSFWVRARVSIPVIAGILCFLSQSASDFFASQCE